MSSEQVGGSPKKPKKLKNSHNDIAVRLVIAVETVDWYRRQILKKLEAKNQQQALLIAQETGLVPPSQTEDETLPARPDEFVLPEVEVKAFFDKLPEPPLETQIGYAAQDTPSAFTSEQIEKWSSSPETEWAPAEFEPTPFEFEPMPDPLTALKSKEVVSDPLPFEVVLDDLAPSASNEKLVNSFDDLQLETQPVLSNSDLASLEQASGVYESSLGFEETSAQSDAGQIPADSIPPSQATEPPPTRKRRRKRKRKAEKSRPEAVTPETTSSEAEVVQITQDIESSEQSEPVVSSSEQTALVEPVVDSPPTFTQPVTASFETDPVYGFSEDEPQAETFSIPEFELYIAEPTPSVDIEPQSESTWVAYDHEPPAGELPSETETTESYDDKPFQPIPEPQIETAPLVEYEPLDNLPTPTEFFVGRRREITEIKHLLASLRWLTLTGPGGVGKTRLALEIAQELRGEFPGGVCFVSLGAISNTALVQDAILRALGIRQLKGQTTKEALKQIFGQRNLLLLLDHLDKVKAAAPQIMDWLAETGIAVIATCRERLNFAEEIEFSIQPFEFTDIKPRKKYRLADLEKVDSLAFFIQQIQLVMPGYQPDEQEAILLAQICARLRGIPLALEWVAARSKLYPPQMILMQLDNRLRAIGSDPKTLASPQQAVQIALSWTHNLLNRDEQLLFAGLGLFGGSWRVEAVEAVFRNLVSMPFDNAVESLTEKRLIHEQVLDNQRSRFSMDASVREYALDKLKNHERLLTIRESFAAHYVDLAEYAASELPGAEQIIWLKRLEIEHDNFRNILNWSLEYHHVDTLVRLTNALWPFWEATERFTEGHYWLEQSLAQDTNAASQAQTKLRHAAGVLAFQIGEYGKARGLLEECLVIHRFSGDRQAEAQILTLLSDVAVAEGDEPRAIDLLTSSLTQGRRMNNVPMIFGALERLTTLATRRADFQALRAPLAETLEYFYQNEDLSNLTRSLLFPASLAAGLWQCDRAVRLYAVCSALMDATGLVLPLGESARYDAALSDMRRFMGPEAFESAWETGFAFTVEQAVAFALEYATAPVDNQ